MSRQVTSLFADESGTHGCRKRTAGLCFLHNKLAGEGSQRPLPCAPHSSETKNLISPFLSAAMCTNIRSQFYSVCPEFIERCVYEPPQTGNLHPVAFPLCSTKRAAVSMKTVILARTARITAVSQTSALISSDRCPQSSPGHSKRV